MKLKYNLSHMDNTVYADPIQFKLGQKILLVC